MSGCHAGVPFAHGVAQERAGRFTQQSLAVVVEDDGFESLYPVSLSPRTVRVNRMHASQYGLLWGHVSMSCVVCSRSLLRT